MFFIVATVILIISFLIALVSLLREQRKVHRINQRHQQGSPVVGPPQRDTTSSMQIVEEPVAKAEEPVAAPVVENIPEEPVERTASENRVDEETVPFPWEVKSGNDVVPQPQPQVLQTDERLPNISSAFPGHSMAEQPSVEARDDDVGSNSTAGLNGSVSLKDLKK